MRTIDLNTWPRRRQFELYRAFSSPHFNVCAPVDITAFTGKVKQKGSSFSVAIVHVLARIANQIPEFRTRIRGAHVVEHDVVHPSVTILTGKEQFSFCCLPFHSRLRDGGGFLKRHASRFQRHGSSMSADILRKTAVVAWNFAEYFISGLELLVVYAGHFNAPGDVRSEYLATWFEKPPDAGIQRFTRQPFPIRFVDGYGTNLDQNFIVLGRRLFHLCELKDIR